jgi:hypothetical protein
LHCWCAFLGIGAGEEDENGNRDTKADYFRDVDNHLTFVVVNDKVTQNTGTNS